MGAEGAVAVVILAMDIRGDHAADGDEPGAGDHRREPAPRRESVYDVGEQCAGLATQQARLVIEGLQPVHRQHGHREFGIEGRVAVSSSIAAGDQGVAALEQAGEGVAVAQPRHLAS